ncbi:hypothetical protein FOA52_000387 [Chlamydomonas sp. UWO 241]|nr:hypothetical protein FOA52_000387 [Chlamydomonas sp. UWO 241]
MLVLQVLAVWQALCGVAVILKVTPGYGTGKCDKPQARRAAGLTGCAWIAFTYLTLVVADSGEAGAGAEGHTALERSVSWAVVAFGAMFSLLAGPLLLTLMNGQEKLLVPLNTVLVAVAPSTHAPGSFGREHVKPVNKKCP